MAPLFPVSYSVKKTIFSKGFSFDFSSSLTKNVLVESACFTFSEPYNVHTLLDVKTPLIHLPSYYPEHFNERPRTDNSWLGKRISPRADSPCVFALAGRWLGDCNRDHPECHIRCETQLPTRVIDVGSFCSSPFLYVSGGRVAPYVTLSHCWGGTIEVRCTPSNIDRYQDEICFSDLPLTLRDAITPTRRLGFRYVWIDALCIIQDNHDDWAQEAVKMGTYYRNSALTIAAGDARNSNEGLLTARYPEFLCNGGHWDGLDHLEKRGWTLQERVLSPRVLHYTNKGIVWECRKFRLHEKGGSQPTNETFQDLVSRVGHAYEAHELARLWERLISIYSERSLTVASDKLPSISGLAAMFQAAHSGVYLAGIWKHEMPACLLWRRSTSAEAPLEKPSSYQTPSWSWASLDGEV
ncbi:HET-domain-containing protein, partial [Cadophora sp. DSE1049]